MGFSGFLHFFLYLEGAAALTAITLHAVISIKPPLKVLGGGVLTLTSFHSSCLPHVYTEIKTERIRAVERR
jgi:hypothetical protein